MDEQKLREIVRDEINKSSNRYGQAKVGYHTHNGADSNVLPFLSVASPGNNGFLSPTKTSGQTVNQGALNTSTRNTPFVMPVPVIYSSASGPGFQGGDAVAGTIVLYVKQGVSPTIELWTRIYDSNLGGLRWYGVDYSPGNIAVNQMLKGPIA